MSSGLKVTNINVELIERKVKPIPVQDKRGALGGKITQGILRVQTDGDLEGNAFIGNLGESSPQRINTIIEVLRPIIVGMNINEREWLWNQITNMPKNFQEPIEAAWAPLDVALWDLQGQITGQPIHELLGTARSVVPAYATYPPRHSEPEGYVNEALEIQSQGFKAYKIHPGNLSPVTTCEMVEKVRAAVGDDMALMFDPNNGYELKDALYIGNALDANGFFWYEDPVPSHDLDAVIKLSQSLKTPINMSDSLEFLLHEATHLLGLETIQFVRGTARKLGITGLKKQMSIAEGFRKHVEIGLGGNTPMNLANLHVMMSSQNCNYYEHWLPQELHTWGAKNQILVDENGNINAPELPGLGLELDEEWVKFHKIATL